MKKLHMLRGNFCKGGTADIFCIEKEWKVAGLEENSYYFIGFFVHAIRYKSALKTKKRKGDAGISMCFI